MVSHTAVHDSWVSYCLVMLSVMLCRKKRACVFWYYLFIRKMHQKNV